MGMSELLVACVVVFAAIAAVFAVQIAGAVKRAKEKVEMEETPDFFIRCYKCKYHDNDPAMGANVADTYCSLRHEVWPREGFCHEWRSEE